MIEQYPVIQGASSFFFKGNDIGVLISHGFVGTPQSVQFLGEYVAQQGYTVHAPRLKGHGTHHEDMERCTYKDWIDSLEEGYHLLQQHCREIFVIGQSMGGTLTLNLASRYPDIKGIMLINAAITTIPVMEKFRNLSEPRFINEGAPDIKDQDVYEITYSKAPLTSIQQLLSVMEETRGMLTTVTCPALAFKSLEDHVVPAENTDYLINHIQSDIKESTTLYNSYHVASMDYEKELIAEQCCIFIKEHTGMYPNVSVSHS